MAYLPIENHGVIGDLHSCALVGIDGTIDWCCLPYFDSPSVFCSILDEKKGGSFAISATDAVARKQMYLPDSNILLTRSFARHGLGQVEDFMPIIPRLNRTKHIHQIVRIVSCIRGEIEYTLECTPAFNYARNKHKLQRKGSNVLFETEGGFGYGLVSPIALSPKKSKLGDGVSVTFTLREGERLAFVFFSYRANEDNPLEMLGDPLRHRDDTHNYWQRWIARCNYHGRWSEMVYRSALTLKMLTFEPTGAIIASPTMCLPEEIGGGRNWDYRYTWVRDASFTLYALMRIGYTEEAGAFMNWLEQRCQEVDTNSDHPLRLMYGIHGEHALDEIELPHLEGYRGSSPVRVGNGAYDQLQLDIYGEWMDSVYLYNKYGSPISYDSWLNVRRIVDWVASNWNQPDEGIWETRGGRKNFVFSRMMCWVALDRASRISLKRSLPGNILRWRKECDKIYNQIMTDGWNPERQAFRQHYDTDALDAANLLMPLVKFIAPQDPRMLSTIDATLEHLTTDSLVYRYDPALSPDGLTGKEGTFSICTFWLVECLTRAGRLEEARLTFQKMLGYGNYLGLYGEEIGHHGETLGNFPQAFTHLSLISAAYNLDRALTSNPKQI